MNIRQERGHWVALLAAICLLASISSPLLLASGAALRPGDTVDLKIGGVPSAEIGSVSGQYLIDGAGFVNMPNIGKVRIGGLSASAAESAIEKVYKEKDIYTNPTIIITMQLQSRWVNVGGEVKNPQRVPYTPDLTVLSSINAAGGFSPYADQRKVRLLRGGQVMIIDVKKIRSDPSRDLSVQPGDQLEIPQSLF